MYSIDVKFRIRYAETDKMGYCYYGNYAQFFEVARVELLRSVGVSYKELEDDGVILPVVNFNVKYLKPAFYDEEIVVKCILKELPKVRIVFYYETYNSANQLINTASTELIFFNNKQNKPTKADQNLINSLKPFFDEI